MLPKRILIADDHSAIRKGLRHILSAEFLNLEFGEAVNAGEVVEKLSKGPWDVIILDIDMPGRNGLDLMQQFKSEKVQTPILVFSMHSEELIALRAFKLGAWGYVAKDSADTELLKALHQIFSGKKYITQKVSELMVSQLEHPDTTAPHERLSEREYQIFVFISKGKTVSEIAKELYLSVPTICTYRARIIEKTGLRNNSEITAYAVRHKFV